MSIYKTLNESLDESLDEIETALSSFEKLTSLFASLIANPERKIFELDGVEVLPYEGFGVRLGAFGRVFQINMKMVSIGSVYFSEISSFLMNDTGETYQLGEEFATVWMSTFGIIGFDKELSEPICNLKQPDAFLHLVTIIIRNLFLSSDFKPRSI